MDWEPEIRGIDVRYDRDGKLLEQYIVGFDHVTKIDTFVRHGVEFVRVWRKHQPRVAFCRMNIAAVYYWQQ